jgi:glycosidase
MIDIVYNHTSPDSVLVREHPEWFLKGVDGLPWRKCEDWSDVVDFDYQSSPHLLIELIDALAFSRDRGVDGFRCDVASLVPTDFWKQARQRVNQYDPGTHQERSPLVWLAESVHPGFLRQMRMRGYNVWSEPELHAAAFDLSYDYDGWERLQKVWNGEILLERYLEYLYAQETLYPKGAKKLRFLENHDQERAAQRFGKGATLQAMTAFYQFLPGVAMTYMGQELALNHKPDLFEKDPIDRAKGDSEFLRYFLASHSAAKEAKRQAPFFSWAAQDVVYYLLRSVEVPTLPCPIDATLCKKGNYLLVIQPTIESAHHVQQGVGKMVGGHTEGRANEPLSLFDIDGTDLVSGRAVHIQADDILPEVPALFVRIGD